MVARLLLRCPGWLPGCLPGCCKGVLGGCQIVAQVFWVVAMVSLHGCCLVVARVF